MLEHSYDCHISLFHTIAGLLPFLLLRLSFALSLSDWLKITLLTFLAS
jgi:hypothetical protein